MLLTQQSALKALLCFINFKNKWLLNMTNKILLIAGLFIAAFNSVQADDLYAADEDSGFYVGIGLARSDANADEFDEAGNEVGLRAGYMFNDNFGVDLTSATLGSTTDNGYDLDIGVVSLGAIGSVPMGERFDVYGKVGAARIVVDVTKDGESDIESSSTELYWGVGSEVDFGRTNLFLEYNRFDAEEANVNTLMTGVKYEF